MAESGKSQMGRISKEMDDFVSGVCIDLAVDINRRLEAATPQDTGLAAKNWIAAKKAGTGNSFPLRRPRRRLSCRGSRPSKPSIRIGTKESSLKIMSLMSPT